MSEHIVKLIPKDMSSSLNMEEKHVMRISGRVPSQMDDRYTYSVERYIDMSDLSAEQIGIIAGFLDAVFDGFDLSCLTGASIIKKEDIKNDN